MQCKNQIMIFFIVENERISLSIYNSKTPPTLKTIFNQTNNLTQLLYIHFPFFQHQKIIVFMKKNKLKTLLIILLTLHIFPLENLAQIPVGLLPVEVSFKKYDKNSNTLAGANTQLQELIERKRAEANEEKLIYESNEYEEQFMIMLQENLAEQLAKEKVKLEAVNIDEMTEEERAEEKLFELNLRKNLVAHHAKLASKGKFKKPNLSSLENDEPSVFIQKVAEKYEKEYIIYIKAIGTYRRTIKDKRYRVNNTDLRGPEGNLVVNVIVFEKTTGKMLEILQHEIGRLTRSNDSNGVSGTFLRDKLFEKFGKKMAKKILKIIN